MWVHRLFQVYCVGPQLADASFAEPVPWTEVAKAHISPLRSSALAPRAWVKDRSGTPATIVSYLNHKHASASLEKLAPPTSGIGLQFATGPREESGGSVRGGAPHRRSEEGGGGTLGVTRTGGSDASTARPSSGKGQWQSYKFGLQHVAGSFLGWSFFLAWSRSLLIDANTRLNSLFARDTTYFLRPADIFAARVSEGSASVSWMKPTYPEMGSAFSLGEFMGVLVALGTDEERRVLSRRR